MSRNRLAAAVAQLEASRRYTKMLINDLSPEEWFWHPATLVTHVAWQVGHLAVAQYYHCLRWIRGQSPADEVLMPEGFLTRFDMGTTPQAGAENNPPVPEILRVFDAVHQQALSELAQRSDEELDVPLDPSRPNYTKLGGLFWDAEHEFLHAGQIGLLRRLMGKPPLE